MIAAIPLAFSMANTAIGVYKNYQTMKEGREMAEEYKQQLENYQRQVRENIYQGLRAPELQEQLALRRTERDVASAMHDVSKLGVAGYSAMPSILEQGRKSYEDTVASLERSKMDIQKLIASDNARLQNMQFAQENQELANLNRAYSSALQMKQAGREGMYNAVQSGIGSASQIYSGQQEMDLIKDIYGGGSYADQPVLTGEVTNINQPQNNNTTVPAANPTYQSPYW